MLPAAGDTRAEDCPAQQTGECKLCSLPAQVRVTAVVEQARRRGKKKAVFRSGIQLFILVQ